MNQIHRIIKNKHSEHWKDSFKKKSNFRCILLNLLRNHTYKEQIGHIRILPAMSMAITLTQERWGWKRLDIIHPPPLFHLWLHLWLQSSEVFSGMSEYQQIQLLSVRADEGRATASSFWGSWATEAGWVVSGSSSIIAGVPLREPSLWKASRQVSVKASQILWESLQKQV